MLYTYQLSQTLCTACASVFVRFISAFTQYISVTAATVYHFNQAPTALKPADLLSSVTFVTF